MAKNAIIVMKYLKSMNRSPAKVLKAFVTIIVSFSILFFIGSINDELYEINTKEVKIPITLDENNFMELDRIVKLSLPEYCKNKILVELELIATDITASTQYDRAILYYYRDIDDTREGGNVEYDRIEVDLQNKFITNIEVFRGAGKAVPTQISGRPIRQDIKHLNFKEVINLIKFKTNNNFFQHDTILRVIYDHKGCQIIVSRASDSFIIFSEIYGSSIP